MVIEQPAERVVVLLPQKHMSRTQQQQMAAQLARPTRSPKLAKDQATGKVVYMR
jgi:threonine synthase